MMVSRGLRTSRKVSQTCEFASAAVVKHRRVAGSDNRSVFPPRSELKAGVGLVSSGASRLGLPMAVFSLRPPMVSVRVCVPPLLIKTPVILDQGLSSCPHFALITSLKTLSPNLEVLGDRTSTYRMGAGCTVQPVTPGERWLRHWVQPVATRGVLNVGRTFMFKERRWQR